MGKMPTTRELFAFLFILIIVTWLIWGYRFHQHQHQQSHTNHADHVRLHFIRPPSMRSEISQPQINFEDRNVNLALGAVIGSSQPQSGHDRASTTAALEEYKPTTQKQPHPIRIAYIFAGSARSFICPKVHWSLRLNVIDAFGGEPYVFVRVSEEDNMNTRTGKGRIWSPQYASSEVNETLKILNPRKVQYFRLSEQEEEMKRNFPETIHRVFRENDLRRYSMFYHRCMGYRLAREWEEEHGMRFDWVALIRLDAAWLEPVLPIQYYANDRVWLTETGYTAFNDQFMLIPRQYSDYLYDLNTKVRKEVYCLGGPDVEKWKCNITALIERNWEKEAIASNLEFCCPDVFTRDTDGYSEIIHYRHLLFGKIPISMGRLPVYITRYLDTGECYGDCPRLHYHFKDFVQEALQKEYPFFKDLDPLDSRSLSMASTDAGRCAFIQSDNHHYSPITAKEYHQLVQQGNKVTPVHSGESTTLKPLDYTQNLYGQFDKWHPSLKLNPNEFNIWRIHTGGSAVDGCLTFNFKTTNLYWSSCSHHLSYKGGRRVDPQQAFQLILKPLAASFTRPSLLRHDDEIMHLYDMPLPNVTQVVMFERYPEDFDIAYDFYCLAVMTDSMVDDSDALKKLKFRKDFAKVRHQQIEKLRIRLKNATQYPYLPKDNVEVKMVKCNTKEPRLEELFYRVDALSIGSHAYSVVGQLRSFAFEGYCVVRADAADMGMHRLMKDHRLTLRACDDHDIHTSRFMFDFELIHA